MGIGAVELKRAVYARLWGAVPFGYYNAMRAGAIAEAAGTGTRAAGQQLMAMQRGDYERLGLRSRYDEAARQLLWWREGRACPACGASLEVSGA